MAKKLRVGELVYLKNVGYPFDNTADGGESWEGASCIVTELNAGANKQMVTVEPLIPIRIRGNNREFMKDCLFYPSQVIRENRPWLKKHLKSLIESKKELIALSEKLHRKLTDFPLAR
jgi:hypothetical protein